MILYHGNGFKVLEPGYGVGDIHKILAVVSILHLRGS